MSYLKIYLSRIFVWKLYNKYLTYSIGVYPKRKIFNCIANEEKCRRQNTDNEICSAF